MKSLTPQHRQILNLHSDGEWHCSTEVEFIRHQGKRVSELQEMGWKFESTPCKLHTNHLSKMLGMRRLVVVPEVIVKCCWWNTKFRGEHSQDCPTLVAARVESGVGERINQLF